MFPEKPVFQPPASVSAFLVGFLLVALGSVEVSPSEVAITAELNNPSNATAVNNFFILLNRLKFEITEK